MPEIIVSAHGGRRSNQRPSLIVPSNTVINYYCFDGQVLSNQDGYALFSLLQNGYDTSQYIYEQRSAGYTTFDYSCWYAPEFAAYCGIFQLGNRYPDDSLSTYSPAAPLLLSQIFQKYEGYVINWLCCRTVAPASAQLYVPKGSFLTEPEPASTEAPDLVPGASVLGLGFDALGTYDLRSLTQQIIRISDGPDESWTYPPTERTYSVPGNTTVVSNTHSSGSSQVFSSQQEFQSYFSAKADIDGSYGGFSAQFSAAYSQSLTTTDSYSYGMYEANYRGWNVVLLSTAPADQVPGFAQDPDVVELPQVFNHGNREKFFALFRKFGTHIVTQSIVGGNLNYYLAVEKSYSTNSVTLQANVALEYSAVFTSDSAKGQLQWSQLGENWATSRSAQISAVGGSAHVLNALLPKYQDNFNTVFSGWQAGVMDNPAVIAFKLKPLSVLFSGEQARAVSEALEAYMNGAIVASASCDYTPGTGPGGGDFTTGSMIIVAGNVIGRDPLQPVPPPDIINGMIFPIAGFQIVLIDAKTLKPILNSNYYQKWGSDQQSIYTEIMEDIGQVAQTGYYLSIAGFALDVKNFPPSAFIQWLNSCGAEMKAWQDFTIPSALQTVCCYAASGRHGLPGKAVENFAVANWWYINPWTKEANANVITLLFADTQLQATGNVTRGSLPRSPESDG